MHNHCNCMKAHIFLPSGALHKLQWLLYCSPPTAPMLILGGSVVMVVGVACCSTSHSKLRWYWPLHLAHFGTNTSLAFAVVSPIATCAGETFSFIHLHTWWYHLWQLALDGVCLATGAKNALALKQLALCVYGLWICVYNYIIAIYTVCMYTCY